VPERPDRIIFSAQVLICVLMLGAAAFARFPNPVPVLFLAGALGAGNAAFGLMRTFGSALLGGVIAAGVALAGIPYVTCASPRFSTVFACTGDSPTWHLTGTVIAAGLAGASLVLARAAAHATADDRLARIEEQLAQIQDELYERRPVTPTQPPGNNDIAG
jgi:hypothetical protein